MLSWIETADRDLLPHSATLAHPNCLPLFRPITGDCQGTKMTGRQSPDPANVTQL